jgi:hypothetical protein
VNDVDIVVRGTTREPRFEGRAIVLAKKSSCTLDQRRGPGADGMKIMILQLVGSGTLNHQHTANAIVDAESRYADGRLTVFR